MSGGPIEPSEDQLAALAAVAGTDDDGPITMLNLNRYRDRADYGDSPPDGVDPDVSGQEAYNRYGEVALRALAELGASIVWHTSSPGTVIGREDDRFHEVVAVWYPSRTAFLGLLGVEGYPEALAHRTAALERAMVIVTDGPSEPHLDPVPI
jgi:uncharacterized protein (DUF1330 family)